MATDVGVCERTVRKWVTRFRAEGSQGLQDRSSRPHKLRRPTPAPVVRQIAALRRRRCTGAQIAAEVGVSTATVSRVLRRLGLNRLSALEPAEPVRRYERKHPGELIHIDIKKLGRFDRPGHRVTGDRTGQSNSRGIGWEFLHVCIDDHSRVAFSQIMPDEKKESAIAFLKDALAYYKSLGVTVSRVMTDNGACYKASPPRRLPSPRPQAHPNQAIHPKDQRKGRALHPDCSQRVGLRTRLPQLKPTRTTPTALAAPIQLAQATW